MANVSTYLKFSKKGETNYRKENRFPSGKLFSDNKLLKIKLSVWPENKQCWGKGTDTPPLLQNYFFKSAFSECFVLIYSYCSKIKSSPLYFSSKQQVMIFSRKGLGNGIAKAHKILKIM